MRDGRKIEKYSLNLLRFKLSTFKFYCLIYDVSDKLVKQKVFRKF